MLLLISFLPILVHLTEMVNASRTSRESRQRSAERLSFLSNHSTFPRLSGLLPRGVSKKQRAKSKDNATSTATKSDAGGKRATAASPGDKADAGRGLSGSALASRTANAQHQRSRSPIGTATRTAGPSNAAEPKKNIRTLNIPVENHRPNQLNLATAMTSHARSEYRKEARLLNTQRRMNTALPEESIELARHKVEDRKRIESESADYVLTLKRLQTTGLLQASIAAQSSGAQQEADKYSASAERARAHGNYVQAKNNMYDSNIRLQRAELDHKEALAKNDPAAEFIAVRKNIAQQRVQDNIKEVIDASQGYAQRLSSAGRDAGSGTDSE